MPQIKDRKTLAAAGAEMEDGRTERVNDFETAGV